MIPRNKLKEISDVVADTSYMVFEGVITNNTFRLNPYYLNTTCVIDVALGATIGGLLSGDDGIVYGSMIGMAYYVLSAGTGVIRGILKSRNCG